MTLKKYNFYDSDWFLGGNGDVEYDIRGEDFGKLLAICFRYSSCVAFCFRGFFQFQDVLSPFEIERPACVAEKDVPGGYDYFYPKTGEKQCSHTRFYRVCPELYEVLLSISDSLFSWLYGRGHCKPEDPTFYREDGSVFFSSVIHEGECHLYLRGGEDASEILGISGWEECTW